MLIYQVSDIIIGIETHCSISGSVELEGFDFLVLAQTDFDFLAGIRAIDLVDAGGRDGFGCEDFPGLRYDSKGCGISAMGIISKSPYSLVHMLNHYNH